MTTLPKLRFLGHSEKKKCPCPKVAVTAVAEDIVGDDAQVLTEADLTWVFSWSVPTPKLGTVLLAIGAPLLERPNWEDTF